MCYLVFDVVPRALRVIFKREWDIRFKETLGEWLDTPENGKEFCEWARPDSQRRYLLATMMNGNREEWDSTMLYYAIVQSKSIGSLLSLSVRLPINDLREVRNETVKNAQGRLQAAEFERIVQKVQIAFETLDLSTSPIKDMMQQRMIRQQSGLPYVEGEVGRKQLQSVEYEHAKEVSSFCRLPFKPPIEIIGRNSDKEKILQELKTLKRNNGNSLSCLIVSGRPGSGKSQLARQVAESFYDDATNVSDAPAFVMLLNAESSESLLESYTSFSQQIKCSEIEVSNILVSEEITSDEKIIRLKNLIQERIHLYTTWLLVIDNVASVRSILNSVPEVGNPQWKMGQLLITTRYAIGPELAVDSFTCHISISQGMEPSDAISLLAAVSGTDDKKKLAKVAKKLDYQPLALVNAATCVKYDFQSNKEPNRAWKEILNELRKDKEMESVSGVISTPELSILKSTDAVVRLAVKALIRSSEVMRHVLTFLSLYQRREFDLDTLITYVQNVEELQNKEEIRKMSESQIKECPLLLLEEEANNVSVGVHQVVFNGITSTLKERFIADIQLIVAVKIPYQMEIDPLEDSSDSFELVDDERTFPFLRSLKLLRDEGTSKLLRYLNDVFNVRIARISVG